MQQSPFQQIWRRDVHVTKRKFLHPLFCIWTSYLSKSDCLVVILKFYIFSMILHAVRNQKPESIFQEAHVNFFITAKIWRHVSITSQLR